MGTSGSVSGASKGSPLVPDWVEDVDDGDESSAPEEDKKKEPVPVATHGRLGSARRALGEFASDGNRSSLRRGVAHYVRSGRGGSAMAARRSAGSARRAGILAGIVSGSSEFAHLRDQIRATLATSGDPQEILAAIAAAASPNDGSLDSDTGQRAASEALQHVLDLYREADPLDLNPQERELLLERFLAIDCFELFMTEVGKHITKKVELSVAASRFREIKDYFCGTFREVNQNRKQQGRPSLGDLADQKISEVCHEVLAEAYFTFEAYLDEG